MNLPDLLQRILGAVLGIALFIAAFVFASVLLAIAATAALLIWGWLWWRTREIRRAAREGENVTIEGEYRVERETRRLDGE
ncbi:MAG TPA: hypothetical protein VLX30_08480 [Burkholderiales bacterium]|nr:hypothetical protein [Burkholderiales bacterium]